MDRIGEITKLSEYIREFSSGFEDLTRDLGEIGEGKVKDFLKELQLNKLEWLQKATILLTQTVLLENMPSDDIPDQEEDHGDDAFMQGELNDNPNEDIEAEDTYPFATTEEKAQETSATEEEKEK